jgi:glutamate-1-semialdehyde 2,1-aminomutase
MNLDPDIITLGKIVGGGFPIGVICGREEIMNLANTKTHTKTKRAYIGGGTFSANPMTMSAGAATLSVLKNNKNTYSKIGNLGDKARKKLGKVFDGKVLTTGQGSLFMTHFVTPGIEKIQSASDVARCNTDLLRRYHFEMIAKNGIFFLPGKLGAFSDAHSDSDVKSLIVASEKFAQRATDKKK